MTTKLLLLLFISATLVGCGSKGAATASGTNSVPATNAASEPAKRNDGNPLMAPVNYLGAVAAAKSAAERSIDTSSLTHEIQLFYAQEGRYPRDLNELVTENYIPSLPKPPYHSRYLYNPGTGEIRTVRTDQ